MVNLTIPQLRVRTGYTYREVYGRMPEVFERLKEIGATTAAIVDTGTWGHVRFEQAADKAEIAPMYGMEVPITDEADGWKFKPVAWVLAKDMAKFYSLTSRVHSAERRGLLTNELLHAEGVIRFLGGAVHAPYMEPDAIDFVDINASSLTAAHASLKWARRHGKPLVLTSYNDMPHPKHASAAYSWDVRDSVGPRHLMDLGELRNALHGLLGTHEFASAVHNTHEVAAQLKGVRLPKAPLIHMDGDLAKISREGMVSRLERGHIREWTPEYEDRLKTELDAISQKGFDSYFLVVSDLVRYAKQHMLVGPARGSSAGSLVCYLTEITEVDPIPHKLLFQRFIDISRSDLPDIDLDFPDTKRHLVQEYLINKYGRANVAKLGNINTLKGLSVIAQVGKKFGISINETSPLRDVMVEYMPGDARYGKGLEDTFTTTEQGQRFAARNPAAAACMSDIEIHPSHTGVHAAGILVCNFPITHFCTVNGEGIAQIDKPDAEYLNLLKIDALGLRTLGVIEDSGAVTADQLFALPLDDQSVLDILNEDKVSGTFQFEGGTLRSTTRSVNVDSFSKIDHLTSLARPGPLSSGMATKYINRANGKEPVKYSIDRLRDHLGETYGVLVYQEQIMSIVKDIGGFDWIKTSAVRKAMSGRKGAEYFDKLGDEFAAGAVAQGIDEKAARDLWADMVSFGAYAFNKSHSVAYAIVTYWTLYLKRYHPLEYGAACLRAAKDDAQVVAILRELTKEGTPYVALDPELSDMNWRVAHGRLIGGVMNAKGYGAVKALAYVQKRGAGTLTDKEKANLAKAQVKFADLNEAHTKWGHFYARPRLAGVTSGNPIIGMSECADREECLIIGKLVKKELGDENSADRVKKRGGKRVEGLTQILDLHLLDDSVDSAMKFRIRPEKFDELGRDIMEFGVVGSWYLVKGWKIGGFSMFIVKNIKRLED